MTFGRLNCGPSPRPSDAPTSDGRFLVFFTTLSSLGACNSSEEFGEMALSHGKQATLLARECDPGAVPAGDLAVSSLFDARATHAEGANGSARAVELSSNVILPGVGVLSSLSRLTAAPETVLRRREKGLEVRGRTKAGRGCVGARSVWLRGVKMERGVASAASAVGSFMGAALLARGVESI